MNKTFYITTPIYYVNDIPHIGHAYTTIAADVMARYYRMAGRETFFLTGLDEHGQKVQQAAAKAGIDPQAHCNRLAPQFQNLWKKLNISNDAFIRTTDPEHMAVVQRFLQQLYDRQLIYRADYTGWYCTFDERFWTEKDVENGLCPDCRRPVERLSESNYFFRMSQYQKPLIDYIESHPGFIKPTSRANEVLGFLQKPMEDLSISRPKTRLSWGIELPFDPDYVTYVWFDALVNYVSALDYLAPAQGRNTFWPATVHLVGKDILTTHAVYWSTILMALEMPLPQTIFAHGWWTADGEKMSKSRGNVINPYEMVDTFGTDAFRYFLLREVPFGQDGDFSRQAMTGRYTSDLANGLGNLLSRTVTMIERFAKGMIPKPQSSTESELDHELKKVAQELLDTKLPDYLHPARLEFNRALEAIWYLVQLADQYIDKTAPWALAKKPDMQSRLDTVLYNAAETLRFLAIATYPFMPTTARNLLRQLGLSLDLDKSQDAPLGRWGGFPSGTTVEKGPALFPRLEEALSKVAAASATTAHAGRTENAKRPTGKEERPTEDTGLITIQDFQKVQLKVARVLAAERIPKSEKLLKLRVDVGTEHRQIVAGIGAKYEPDQLVGKTIVVVANLKPAKLMGVESQGMVLAAGDKEVMGLVTLAEDAEPGTKIK